MLYAFIAAILASVDGRLDGDDHYALWTTTSIEAGVPFYEPGSPAASWLSYLGQRFRGHRTMGEVLLAATLRALGMIAAYVLTRRLAGHPVALVSSVMIALVTLGATIYGSDKFFIYPVAVLALWMYIDGRLQTWTLSIVTGAAFLLRHDPGLYVGAVMTIAVLWRTPRQLPAFGLTVALMLLPWAISVQRSEGLLPYFAERLEFSRRLGLADARPALLYFEPPIWSQPNAARWLWHVAWATGFGALFVAWRDRSPRVALMAIILLVAAGGLMRRPVQAAELATLWVPLLGWLTQRYVTLLVPMSIVSIAAAVVMMDARREAYQIAIDNGGLISRPISAVRFPSRRDRSTAMRRRMLPTNDCSSDTLAGASTRAHGSGTPSSGSRCLPTRIDRSSTTRTGAWGFGARMMRNEPR